MLHLIKQVQKDRPGWRFCLLGGDVQYAYKRNKKGKIVGVNRKKTETFGWRAEFFGDIDPSKNTGERHVVTQHFVEPGDAVLVACTMARQKISEEDKK